MSKGNDRVCSLQAQHVPDGRVRRGLAFPKLEVLFQAMRIPDLNHLSRLLHCAIIRKLPLCLGPRLLGTVPAWQQVFWFHVASDLGGHAETDSAPAHFRKADSASATIRFVG